MREESRSEQVCPVCGQHTLALDQPPQIDVMGIQQYSDILGMGDLRTEGSVGIVCLGCGTRWRDKDAFDRNDPEPDLAEDDFAGEEDLAEDDFAEDLDDADDPGLAEDEDLDSA